MDSKDSKDWQRLGALFDQLVELEPDEQRRQLESLDIDDADKVELAELLAADQADAGALDRPGQMLEHLSGSDDQTTAGAERDDAPRAALVGRRIGRWVLDEPLGQGGSAIVFRAHREDGFDQVAALKLLTLGALAASRQRFFDRERDFLARLKHPHIATLLDGGVSEDGTPYLVTELVRGERLDEYCQRAGPGLDARLDLFLDICDTVAYAHRQLVVHRDLKPSNILVDDEGHIYLLDFGIAKLLGESDATGTIAAFTPAYAAPEQWSGEPATTATDVYSLGLILYQLCTGEPPALPAGSSDRYGSSQANSFSRSADATISFPPGDSRLDRDLQAIVELALRLNGADRYPDARALAEDLRRWRSGHPTLARPASRLERGAKFLRRNPIASAASALALLALLALVVTSTWQGRRVAKQRDLARSEADKAQQTVDLLRDFLSSADPEMHGRDLKVLELLEAFEPRLESVGDPAIRATLLHTYALTYESLGELDAAQRFLETAIHIRRSELGARHPETLLASTDLSLIFFASGELERAVLEARNALDAARPSLGAEHPVTLDAIDNLATVLAERGEPEEAEALHREAYEIRRRVFGEHDDSTVVSKNGLAVCLLRLGRAPEAEPLLVEALEQNRRSLGEDHPRTLAAMNNLAFARGVQGDFQGAVPIFRELAQRLGETLGDDHPRALISVSNLAAVLSRNGDDEEAESLLLELAERQQAKLGERHPDTLSTRSLLATTWRKLGRPEQAAWLARQVLEARRDVLGVAHPTTLGSATELARTLIELDRQEEAAAALRRGLEESHGVELQERQALEQLLAELEARPDAGS